MFQSSHDLLAKVTVLGIWLNRGILSVLLQKVCVCLISKRENEKRAQMQHHNRLYGNSIMKEFVPMVIRAVPHK